MTARTYLQTWLERYPRADRTNTTNEGRVRAVLDVKIGRRPFGDWPMEEVRPREAVDLLDYMLREQGRAAAGAAGILSVLAAMWRDAICDGHASTNPFREVTVRANDSRVRKAPRRLRVYSWQQMHELAAAAPGRYGEAMCRVLSDAGLRLGEMLPLERADVRLNGCPDPECRAGDVPHLHVQRTAHEGRVTPGTKSARHRDGRVAPVGEGLERVLRALPPRIDTPLLLPSLRGKVLRAERFYREVWYPARRAVGLADVTPHEFRHSWVSLMRAAGVDVADVADAAGHTIETATAKYTHGLGLSFEAMRRAAG